MLDRMNHQKSELSSSVYGNVSNEDIKIDENDSETDIKRQNTSSDASEMQKFLTSSHYLKSQDTISISKASDIFQIQKE